MAWLLQEKKPAEPADIGSVMVNGKEVEGLLEKELLKYTGWSGPCSLQQLFIYHQITLLHTFGELQPATIVRRLQSNED